MKEFVFVFRRDFTSGADQPSPEKMQSILKNWQDWMSSLAAGNKLASPGNRLGSEGKVVKANKMITNGPYVELKESIGGYIMVKAATIDEAAELATGCPVLTMGGNVEVRPVVVMEDNS